MCRLFLICGAGALIAMAAVTAQVRDSRITSDSGITRQLIIDEKTVQVVRSTYKPGTVEPPGPHAFDVVIVPLSSGEMEIEIAGKKIVWKPGEAFFIGRGLEHRLANKGRKPVDFVSIHIP